MLRILKENGLRLKQSKCTFFSDSVVYLGFKITSKGVETVQEKVRPVLEAPPPKDTSQLKSFLGMIQYYHRHLPDMATLLEPMHLLLRNGVEWTWGVTQQAAFVKAKGMLASTELLVHYDPEKPVILAVDASPYGVGVVLKNDEPL